MLMNFNSIFSLFIPLSEYVYDVGEGNKTSVSLLKGH
ncbi:hypothetical protein ETA_04870 [Erwinia tasmaniensis Et1/99]|uniref:Uncharacterized protein n=1 Tax=Erwinia tasmaniensis (strain DSM 17950 / CFBP 7177 / CIP 109463 / NCPPB 4357 / Et1/99) TaxID=465817 RepID=B2VL00_ERWT9|nr:hypothetical protein ETA_04870 [Erwinia tasmaniensis Et1/99]